MNLVGVRNIPIRAIGDGSSWSAGVSNNVYKNKYKEPGFLCIARDLTKQPGVDERRC